ncbi:AbiJ-related protein [Nonomuraea recticatena]
MAQPFTPSPRDHQSKITAVTRRDVFDYLRAMDGAWWGRLDEIAFLDGLYDLDALPSSDSRYTTARRDIGQHRMNNLDWEDDWIFEDSRFQLLDGPDEVLLAFLARIVHPEVQPDADQAARQVDQLNRLLEPDGWALRAQEFLSGRPIYAPVATGKAVGPVISLPLRDDDASKLDLVLGQAHHLLDADGQGLARDLLHHATLTLRRDGGVFHPMSGDNWTAATYEAVLTVDPALVLEFTPAVTELIWRHLGTVLKRLQREDVRSLVVEAALLPLPPVPQNWRQVAATPAATNQARRERAVGEGYPTLDGLVFSSRAELVVYQILCEIQRDSPLQRSIAILPLPSAKLRDAGVRSPDFTILGNGRAVIIEVDGPHHYGRTRKADDEDRDRHWSRCGVRTIRIAHEQTNDRVSLKERLHEDLTRALIPPH